VTGRVHIPVQTDVYLEELVDTGALGAWARRGAGWEHTRQSRRGAGREGKQRPCRTRGGRLPPAARWTQLKAAGGCYSV